MEKPTIEKRISEQENIIRDKTLEKLVTYIQESLLSQEEVHQNEELFVILSHLVDLTQQKLDIRSSLSDIPETAENLIEDIQEKIISLSKELEENYPDIHEKIKLQNTAIKNPN